MTLRKRLARGSLALLVPACLGCARGSVVQRAYGSEVVEGRYVPPEAYAAFLRGAIAEAGQRPVDALRAYLDAADRDPASPEPWTRMAEVRCKAGDRAGGTRGEEDAARALKLDSAYAPGWAARAACAAARGDAAAEHVAAARAAQLDPQGDGANVLLARTGDTPRSASPARGAGGAEVLVALTVTAHDPVVAWSALASWSEAHGDVALWARALVELARVAPERRTAIARSAEELAGAGNLGEARAVAAAALEAGESPLPPELGLAARLALDEAVARRDAVAVRRRATRGRLSLDEAGGRALLGGERGLARGLVAVAAAADPDALGARLVLAVADGGDLLGTAASVHPGDTAASAAALVAFAEAFLHQAAPVEVRAALAAAPHLPLVAGDDRVVRAAVDLASRGVLPAEALPPDGALELAAILGPGQRTAAGVRVATGAAETSLDLRHRYLALAMTDPDSAPLRELADRLRGRAAVDPVVAAAAAIVQLADGAPIAADASSALLARNPADPLLAAMALRLAERVGDADMARRARAALGALSTSTRTVD